MNRSLDLLAGRVLAKLGDVTLWNWSTYHALFLPPLRGERRHRISRQRARAAFWNAAATVPAYGSFLREHGTQHPRRWEDVPVMDKENYIKRHPLPALCQHGKLPLRGAVIDESSGTSGIATNWVRGHHERDATRRLLQYTALATFGDEGFVMLNAFALGPWATGMNVSMALVDRCLLKSTGPDQGKIVRTLEVLGPEYRYVICGYPPFMKTLVDTAGIDWSQYEVYAVVGGEGMSEGLRASLNRAFRKTYSSYGASDLAINLAVETDFSIALRQAIAADPTLGQALYGAGADTLPMVFQYDPLNQLIEADEQGSLLFTMNR
ncbi:MAG TPA: CoF synthetase, partial [bacterium]|nr:CoF synthetase [bacterium]